MIFLVHRARKHDKDAFVQLMKACGPGMYKAAKAILGNDADALEALPEKSSKTNDRYLKKVVAAAVACVMVTGGVVCYSNPTLAAKIPVLGAVFGQIEDTETYSGTYSDQAAVLTSDESQEEYTAEDAGVKVTASEVVYDDISVFLTLKVEVKEGNLSCIPTHDTTDDGTETASSMYLWGTYEISDRMTPKALTEDAFHLEGKVVDDTTFLGMVKLDLGDEIFSNETLTLNLSGIGYDDQAMLDAEEISASHKIEGNWKLDIPFTSDAQQIRTVTLDTKGENYQLEKIKISPYQIVAEVSVPYMEKEITHEEYEEAMKSKAGSSEELGISYEAYVNMNKKTYAEAYTIIYNQDGERIAARQGYDHGQFVFAVQGKEIRTLHVLVFSDQQAWIDNNQGRLTDAAIDAAEDYEIIEIEKP